MTFERFAVVRVPFPFTDREATKNRPALVLSDPDAFNTAAGHSVMAMITSAANQPWPLDCPIADLRTAGLPAPSKVRFKLFTLDHRLVRGRLGRLSADDEARVRQGLARLLGLPAEGRPSRKVRARTRDETRRQPNPAQEPDVTTPEESGPLLDSPT